MLDRIIILIMMLAFVCFVGLVVVYVREPDLTIVIVMMVAFAMHDFWISALKPGAKLPGMTATGIEERPSAVSGKPLAGPKDDYTP
mgnify:CR=1 FL=1